VASAGGADGALEAADKPSAVRRNRGDAKRHKQSQRSKGAQFLVQVDSPVEIGPEHRGSIMELTDDLVSQFVPEGFAGDLDEDKNFMEKPGIMVRQPFLEVLEQMKELEAGVPSSAPQASIFSGPRGQGKSMSLNLALLRARANGWITLSMLDTREWVTEKGAMKRGTGTAAVIVPSKLRPGMYSQPRGAQSVLERTLSLHKDQLAKLRQQRKYEHNAYVSEDGFDSLATIAERGIRSAVYAGDAMYDLRMELGLVEDFPVLIVSDQANALYWPTCFYAKGSAVGPDKLLALETFRDFDTSGEVRPQYRLKRGLRLAAPTAKFGFPMPPATILEHFEDTALQFFKPFDVRGEAVSCSKATYARELPVPAYDDAELRNLVIFLKKQKALDSTNALEEQAFRTLQTLTSANPRRIRDALTSPLI